MFWLPLDVFGDMMDWFFDMVGDMNLFHYPGYEALWWDMMNVFDAWNAFFPVDELFWMTGMFLSFIAVFLIVKVILKLIPTIG